jgi:hypothetical protein
MSADRTPMSLPALDALEREFERISAGQHEATPLRRLSAPRLAWGFGLALVLLALSFTPPGRAATGWVARVTGLGGEPALPHPESRPGTAVVVDDGTTPDRTPYEVVAEAVNPLQGFKFGQQAPARSDPISPEVARDAQPLPAHEIFCAAVDWPSVGDNQSDRGCVSGNELDGSSSPVKNPDLTFFPGRHTDTPAVFTAEVEDSSVASIEVTSHEQEGSTKPIQSHLVSVDGSVLQKVGAKEPFSVLIVPLSADEVAAASSKATTIEATVRDAQGSQIECMNLFRNFFLEQSDQPPPETSGNGCAG